MQWNDKQPIYVQLKDKIAAAVLEGAFKEGEAIPSIRQVAADYQLNPVTISNAYQLLQDSGIIEKRRGLGMFVTAGAKAKLLKDEKQKFVEEEWPEMLRRVKQLGLNLKDLPQ